MKPETLNALLVDRELGELPPDIKELLDAYLAAVPATQAEADATARTVTTARDTIRRYPELVPTAESEAEVIPIFLWLTRAAAVVAVAALAGWFGYHAGNTNIRADKPVAVDRRFDNLWTRYEVAYDSDRAAFVVEKRR